MKTTVISILKLVLLTILIFVFDFYARNLFAPFVWGQRVMYPFLPISYIWVYLLGVVAFHLSTTYCHIGRFAAKFLLAVFIYIFAHLPFALMEELNLLEIKYITVASLMVGVILSLLHLGIFKKPFRKAHAQTS